MNKHERRAYDAGRRAAELNVDDLPRNALDPFCPMNQPLTGMDAPLTGSVQLSKAWREGFDSLEQ
jgi:hypothetical protein